MTDGSGINHREYSAGKPTVWAMMLGLAAFFYAVTEQKTNKSRVGFCA